MSATRDSTDVLAEAMLEHARREVEALSEDWQTVELHIKVERGQHKALVSVSYHVQGECLEVGGTMCDCGSYGKRHRDAYMDVTTFNAFNAP
jgi:hypothetical protein